jgi:hypothetical protein
VTAQLALGSRVLVDGSHVGDVTGVLLDGPDGAPIGLEVSSTSAERRFLPWVVVTTRGEGVVETSSTLLLIDSCEAYLRRGAVICREPATSTVVHGADVSAVGRSGTRTS